MRKPSILQRRSKPRPKPAVPEQTASSTLNLNKIKVVQNPTASETRGGIKDAVF